MSHLIELLTDDRDEQNLRQRCNSINILIKTISYSVLFQCEVALTKLSQSQMSFQFKKIVSLTENYQITFKIFIADSYYTISSQLIYKSTPISISCRKIRAILQRVLPKYQSRHQQKIFINNNGSINTKIHVYLNDQFINSLISKPKFAQSYALKQIKKFITSSASLYKMIIIKINFNKQQIRQFKPNFYNSFERTKRICNCCRYLPINKAIHQKRRYELPKQQETYYYAIHKNTWLYYFYNDQIHKTHENLNYVMQTLKLEAQGKNELKNGKIDQKQIFEKIYLKNIKYMMHSKDWQQNKESVFNQINIANSQTINWQAFQSTGFSNLLKAKIKYENLSIMNNQAKSQQDLNQKTVILKYQSPENRKTHLIRWQKQIIKHFSCKYCIFILKYYSTQQKLLQFIINRKNSSNKYQFLISEYIKRGNLKNWLIQNTYASTCTKINIVIYLLYGINCIHNFDIIHLDLKPANILIDKNNITKITDFGSAYNQQVYNKMKAQKVQYLLSFSIPYTPPQIFMKKKKPLINQKCDIYSLGIILYEIYFQKNVYDLNLTTLSKLYFQLGKALQNEDQNITYCTIKILKRGLSLVYFKYMLKMFKRVTIETAKSIMDNHCCQIDLFKFYLILQLMKWQHNKERKIKTS